MKEPPLTIAQHETLHLLAQQALDKIDLLRRETNRDPRGLAKMIWGDLKEYLGFLHELIPPSCDYCGSLEYYNYFGDAEYFCTKHGMMVNELQGCWDWKRRVKS